MQKLPGLRLAGPFHGAAADTADSGAVGQDQHPCPRGPGCRAEIADNGAEHRRLSLFQGGDEMIKYVLHFFLLSSVDRGWSV